MYWRYTDVARGALVIIEGCFEGGLKGGRVVDTDECERRVAGGVVGGVVGGRHRRVEKRIRRFEEKGGGGEELAAVGRHRDRRRCSIHDVNFARVCGCTLHDRVESNR